MARCSQSYYAHPSAEAREQSEGWQSKLYPALQKRHGLHARNVEPLSAPQILTGHLIVQQHHVALRLGEAGAVALVAAGRQAVLLLAHHPSQIVGLGGPAKRAV